ncbi:MAG: CPBP family intramembrane metalloprotease [Chloroflexi bacterium]|nr:CPBP family intramembrane metalloprotease [Chloroflexota bacterium]MCL5274022.1 CPBP family intramembrane metalloprotease [Chloroflexota bacterium]
MPSNRALKSQSNHTVLPLKPMPLWQTGLFFGIPTVLIAVGFLVVLPALQQTGMQRMIAYTVVQLVFIGGLIPATLLAMALEGRPLNWPTIRARLRLKPLHGESWNWTTMGILVFAGSYYAGIWLVSALTRQAGLQFPDTNYPLDAGSAINRGLWIVNLIIGIAAEELWWRGYVLPRQELVHGQRTWLLHGLLWALVHVGYSGWFVIGLIIPCCALAFIAQGLKNTTPGIAMQVFVASLNLILGGL